MLDIERRGIRYDVGNELKGLSIYVYVKYEDLEQIRRGKSENRQICKFKVDICFYQKINFENKMKLILFYLNEKCRNLIIFFFFIGM